MESASKKPEAVVICGPTCVGKTSFAIGLAHAFNGEIVGADSMQVYRHMDIGTAKPTKKEQASIGHHMIDVVDPDEHFDAEMYAAGALEVINNLQMGNRVPFVTGGTGLYIKSLIHGLFDATARDESILVRLKAEAAEMGCGPLYRRLQKCDSEAAKRIHGNDTFRIIRALEVFETTGMPISEYQQAHGFAECRLNALKIGLKLDRTVLYERIDLRVDSMMKDGFVDEVKGLLDIGYGEDLKSMLSIGYRHMVDFIKGRIPMEEALRTMKRDTRRYAKRQMTWFGADPDIIWVESGDFDDTREKIAHFLRTARETAQGISL